MIKTSSLAVLTTMTCALAPEAAAAGQPFRGPFVAFEASRQSIIAGADVRGVDTLAQRSRVIASASAGYRWLWDNGLLLGVEAGLGRGDQSVRLSEPANALDIRYSNNSQRHFGGFIGWSPTSARDTVVFGYASEVKRSFDVRGAAGGVPFRQSDGQGILRFGLGAERALASGVGLRVMIGTSRADFGGRTTNIKPDREVEAALGATYQF